MYEQFYGLSRTPFAVTPDPAMLFMSKAHREALATIIYGVETRKGFLVCTGEVGTGKSTIIRAFFDQARADAVKLIYTFTPQVTPFEMARYICAELGLDDPESVFAAVPRLQLKLLEEFENGRTVVLMIDEAQLLPPETLEFLRLLSNFETDTEKLIQIVLVGQPEVDTMLARRDMRQVAQRVALRARLAPLDVEESFEYLDHRLRVSGAADLTQVMSPSAAWLIAEAAGGIPRILNILADNALIAGFGAAQRPLGSQLAGAAVTSFLAKSGAPRPAEPPRFAGGWRTARRLRSALAREKSEPVDWIAVAPAAGVQSAAPVLPQPPQAAPAAPPPRPAPPAAPPAVIPSVATSTAPAAEPPPDSNAGEPGPEFGTPASIVGLILVEPVAEPAAQPATPPDAAKLGADRANGAAGAAARAERPVLVGFAQHAGAASGPAGPPARWPALSRVRNDFAAAPRTGPA
jgi:general secretion pathway protein A